MKPFLLLFLFFFLLFPLKTIYAQNYVGIILSGHEKDCEVDHQGKLYQCGDKKQLYIGDVVRKRPSVKILKIKWAPHVSGVATGETTLKVTANQPDKLKGNTYVADIKGYINDFIKPAEHGAIPLVTRGQKPRPHLPLRATLILNYPITISGVGEEVKSITIIDSGGQKVYERQFKNKEAPFLNPGEARIKPLETYRIYINNDNTKPKIDIVLMDGATQEEIHKGLTDIDREDIAPPDKIIEKAVYLQLISDAHPDKIDLYWLSNQLLQEGVQRFTKDQENIVRALRERYYNHWRAKQ